MKKIFLSLLAVCATCGAMAQSITSYYMPDAIQRTTLNAAFAPERGYVSIPFVGSLSLNVNGNLSIGSVIYQNGDDLVSLMDSSISAAEALGNLSEGANFMSISNRLDILNFGGYFNNHRDFWTFNLSLRTNASYNLPYEFFEFARLGTTSNISDINIYAESFVDVGFGYSKMISEKLTVGGRFKLLVGLASANANISKFNVKMDSDEWKVDMAGELDIYGAGITNDGIVGQEFDTDDISMSGFSPAGFGAAIDLGAEYAYTKQLRFSLAVNDLGFVKWSDKNCASAALAASQSFTGVDIDGSGNATTPDFSLDDLTFNNVESEGTARFMQANINAGVEYRLFDELLNVGALYTAQFWYSKTMHNITASAHVRPLSWCTVATSYSFVNNRGGSVGFALNLSPSWFNFYVATDILTSKKSAQYIPINQSNMSVSLGLAVPIGQRSLRSKYTKWTIEE